jgi:diguanylate cyclase (GGDEF)-like protein
MSGGISEADLKRICLFKNVNLESIKGLLEDCPLQKFERGDVVIGAGQSLRHIYLVLEGYLRVHPQSLDQGPIVVLGPGDITGEISVIDHQPAAAYVVADDSCLLIVVHEDILWSLIRSSHAAALNLLYILAKRLRHSDVLIAGDMQDDQDYEQYGSMDALTGLHSRSWLEMMLKRQFLRSATIGEPLSVIMIDIDDFREFNQAHGRIYSDRVLYSLAHQLSEQLRPTDIIARYGGDEFMILLPHVNLMTAQNVAERLRQDMKKSVPVTPDGNSVPYPTLSFGLAEARSDQTAESFIKTAEDALSRAKEMGGNCIVG